MDVLIRIKTKTQAQTVAKRIIEELRSGMECVSLTVDDKIWIDDEGQLSFSNERGEPWRWKKNVSENDLKEMIYKHRLHLWIDPDIEIDY